MSRARGFLNTEACTTRDLAARLELTLAQPSLRKNHHEQSRGPADLSVCRQAESRQTRPTHVMGDVGQRGVDELLETQCSRLHGLIGCGPQLLGSKDLVREIERHQHRKPEDVAGRRRVDGKPHLAFDVRRQLVHVVRIEIAPDRVLLTGDLDGDDAGVGHGAR